MVEILAHRGASRAESENTVAAFRRACVMGADAVELDVRRTAQGSLIVHHNPHLVDGRLICETLDQQLPSSVATLGEALDACEGMWVNVEIKNDPDEADFDASDAVADAVIEHLVGWQDNSRWLISSFRRETIDRCRLVAPAISTAWLTVDVDARTARQVMIGGHRALHPWYANVTEQFIADCHGLGVQVNVWTCDDPDWMLRLAAWGVDGICTNVPDVAIATLGQPEAGLADGQRDQSDRARSDGRTPFIGD